jgi:hypothetical protein
MIKNVNTIEDYRNMDKQRMILQAGKTVRACQVTLSDLGQVINLPIHRSGMLLTTALSTPVRLCYRRLSFSPLPI